VTSDLPVDGGRTLESWEGAPLSSLRAQWGVPELLVFDTVGSTNDIVKTLAEHGAPAGVVAIADHQSRGRGRRDRRWDAPPGRALLMSMLFRPAAHSPADFAGTIPLRVGMAVARAIAATAGVDVRLKWPNDVLAADGRKVAGILCESSLTSTGLAFTVVGIGINVLQTEQELGDTGGSSAPAASAPAGASLRMLAANGHTVSRLDVASALIHELASVAALPVTPLTVAELCEYRDRDSLRCHAVTADGVEVGKADGVGALGELRVRRGSEVRSIHAGTIRKV
jgi:biotin-[acetyl-CoA-carboxylase] ligase BirA-like protein